MDERDIFCQCHYHTIEITIFQAGPHLYVLDNCTVARVNVGICEANFNPSQRNVRDFLQLLADERNTNALQIDLELHKALEIELHLIPKSKTRREESGNSNKEVKVKKMLQQATNHREFAVL
jgi:hypothetical protein